MSEPSRVSEAEVEAILDLVRPAAESVAQILPRDFKAPRRLSRAQLDALVRRAEKTMPEVSAHLSTWLRGPHRARVADVVEGHVATLVDGFVEPLRVLAFDVGPQLGFVAWDLAAMTGAIEVALGAPDTKSAKARPLTSVEERMMEKLLARVAMLVCAALGVEAANFRVMREKKELALADDGSVHDPQRIGVHLALEGAVGESTLRIYVPAVKPPETAKPATPAKGATAPRITDVDVELCAELGTVVVPLQDLMSLEIGDVIVLEAKVGDPVALTAEGQVRGRGELGRHDGKLAVRVRSVDRTASKSTDGK